MAGKWGSYRCSCLKQAFYDSTVKERGLLALTPVAKTELGWDHLV